ncbi:MAG: SIR2 family protein [Myxococcales bacterium]|nr:SIR2 family protein [Myxococcales bacterium]
MTYDCLTKVPELMEAAVKRKLVVFAGAGVSMGPPANLPDFRTLAENITGRKPPQNMQLEVFLGKAHDGGTHVHQNAANELSKPGLEPTDLHRTLLGIFGTPDNVRLITTNFDPLFDKAALGPWPNHTIPRFAAPALPSGDDFFGLVYLHGHVESPKNMVLTDGDYGRAYLTKGWASRFLVDVFQTYTVLFVGYSYGDIPMQYLTRAIAPGTARRFTMVGKPESPADRNVSKHFADLGISAIAFDQSKNSDYSRLLGQVQDFAKAANLSTAARCTEVQDLAQKGPPQNAGTDNPEPERQVREIFQDATKLKWFTTTADVRWLPWLDEHGLLGCLFAIDRAHDEHTGETATSTAAASISETLIQWVADRCMAPNHGVDLVTVLHKNRRRPSRRLWQSIAFRLYGRNASWAADDFERWAEWLLDTVPDGHDINIRHSIEMIGGQCKKIPKLHLQWRIYSFLFRNDVTVVEPGDVALKDLSAEDQAQFPPGFVEDRALPRWSRQKKRGNSLPIKSFWDDGFLGETSIGPTRILPLMVDYLESRHRFQKVWTVPEFRWRESTYPFTQVFEVEVIRKCLSYLADHPSPGFQFWVDELVRSPSPLVRCAVVRAIASCWTADQQVLWSMKFEYHDADWDEAIWTMWEHALPHTSPGVLQQVEGFIQRMEAGPRQEGYRDVANRNQPPAPSEETTQRDNTASDSAISVTSGYYTRGAEVAYPSRRFRFAEDTHPNRRYPPGCSWV